MSTLAPSAILPLPHPHPHPHNCNIREVDPGDMSDTDLAEHIAEERAGDWNPPHYVPQPGITHPCCGRTTYAYRGPAEPLCQRHAGADVGDTYAMTSDRAIFDRWIAAGWACRTCAEVLHS